jgi:transcriptional regulator with XRE-family HTH domain
MSKKSGIDGFHTRLLELVRRNGVRREELRQYIVMEVGDVSESTIYRWFRGTFLPSVPELLALARYFKVSVNFLLGIDPGEDDEEQREALSDDEERMLWLVRLIGVQEATRRLVMGRGDSSG